MTDRFLNLLYPRHCPGCGEILKDQEALLCPECRSVLSPIRENYCLKCGVPVDPEEEYCRECSGKRHFFTAGRSAFLYDDRWRLSLERFKFYGYREFGDFYSCVMGRIVLQEKKNWHPELIVPVPLSSRKERQRGFNQAALLAEKTGKMTGIPVDTRLVRKVVSTRDQKTLSGADRRQNLRGAFSVTERITGITALVVDDVYTTGSTIDEMSRVLLEAGAAKVYFVTFCTAPVLR